MKTFFLFSVCYFLVALALLFTLRDNPVGILTYTFIVAIEDSKFLFGKWPFILPIVAIGWYASRQKGFKHLILRSFYAFLGCVFFSAAFGLAKTNIPHIVPFYADEMLANLDAALHLGHDPWVLTHKLADHIPYRAVEILYFDIWLLPAWFLPLFMALSDSDTERTNRYLVLFALCWIGLGNVLATMFSSVGPVYYDRLMDTQRFAGLTLALENAGFGKSFLGYIQDYLWNQYVETGQSFGSGISAFPSVHVGVATITAFYLTERSRLLMPVGVLFLAAITFASVYNGWHYAVDGYASILLMAACWAALQRRKVTFSHVAAA